jgi:hypothetical protein
VSKEDKEKAGEDGGTTWRAGGEGCCEVEMVVGDTGGGAEARAAGTL